MRAAPRHMATSSRMGPCPDLCVADFLNSPSKKTPIFLRFSTVVGSRGSADTPRDVRGFAIKFYTMKAYGTWSATIFPSFSFRMRSSFRT